MRDSCIFYRSFFESINELPDVNKLQIYEAIFSYSLDFKDTELTGLSKSIFTLIKPQLDANIKRFNSGNIPKKKQKASKTEAKQKQNKSKPQANNNVNNNVNDNVNQNDNKKENKNNKDISEPSSVSLHSDLKKMFCSFYLEKTTSEYYWEAKDGAALKKVIDKLLFKIKEKNPALKKESEESEIKNGFNHFLKGVKDKWILENLSMTILNSKFNEIINQIINPNGKSTNNKQVLHDYLKAEFNSEHNK